MRRSTLQANTVHLPQPDRRCPGTIRRLVLVTLCLAGMALLAACGDPIQEEPAAAMSESARSDPTTPMLPIRTLSPSPDATTAIASTAAPTGDGRVQAILAGMSIEQKVGQLMMICFDGVDYSEELEHTIQALHAGGIILFGSNVGSLEQMQTLIRQAQETALTQTPAIPLAVAVDHEGGIVNRFGNLLTQFPGNMALAATGDLENARRVARVMAEELTALGITVNLAPVVDVNSNPANPVIGTRSFGSDPQVVGEYGAAMIETLQQNGIAAVAKHFPGHGDTSLDSHSSLPLVPHDRAHLDTVELPPFRAAIDVDVSTIMTAHVVFPVVDGTAGLPATLSGPVLTGLLREEMGFRGVIATDSLGMGAIVQTYGIAEAAALALQAGADWLMFGKDPTFSPSEQYPVYQHLVAQVRSGAIPETRLDAAVRRVLNLKADMGMLDYQSPAPGALSQRIRTEEHLELARQIAVDSVTLVRNEDGLLPLDRGAGVLLVYPTFVADLWPAMARFSSQIEALPINVDPGEGERQNVQARAQVADIIIIATTNVLQHPTQAELVASLSGLPVVVVALYSPYDLLAFPDQSTYVVTYSDIPVALEAVSEMLYGELSPAGTLPIALGELYPVGHGLQAFE